jgi:hypothetical protein
MGGSPTTVQNNQQQSTTNPWAPAAPVLTGILGQLGGAVGNAGVTPAESTAFGQLAANAQAGNPYASAIGDTANTLLAGGGTQNLGGTLTDAYGNLQSALTPWATGAMADPAQNPVLANQLATMSNDVTNQVNQQFAAAGRDLSPDNTQALARGIMQGAAPLLSQAQQQGIGAAGTLFNAGTTTAQDLAGLQQQSLANQQAGITAANAALAAQNYAPNQAIATAQQEFGLPLQNLSQISALADPLASQFATTDQSGTTTSQTQVPLWQQLLGAGIGGVGALGKLGAFGSGGWLTTSDARVKENKVTIGALNDGTPVYAFNYVGHPETRIGLLAQDVEKRRPDAVAEVNGVKAVDYDKATELAGILGRIFGGR